MNVLASKYVILSDGVDIYPVTFATYLSHDAMAAAVLPQLPKGAYVVSAGFVEIDWEMYECFAYGESESIGIGSRPEDSEILSDFLS